MGKLKTLKNAALMFGALSLAGCGEEAKTNTENKEIQNKPFFTASFSTNPNDKLIIDAMNADVLRGEDPRAIDFARSLEAVCLLENCSVQEMINHTSNCNNINFKDTKHIHMEQAGNLLNSVKKCVDSSLKRHQKVLGIETHPENYHNLIKVKRHNEANPGRCQTCIITDYEKARQEMHGDISRQ